MRREGNFITPGATYRHVFILGGRDWWPIASPDYDPSQDLVLTYDFGLKTDVEAVGGVARYVDHLCSQCDMHENNFRMYRFFRAWHLDAEGADLFRFRDVDFGFSFRIDIWNDFTFFVRTWLCLEQLKLIEFSVLFVGTDQEIVEQILDDMETHYVRVGRVKAAPQTPYYFPIHRWVSERLNRRGLWQLVRDVATATQGLIMSGLDRMLSSRRREKRVFVQEYYPTRDLLQRLQRTAGVKVVLGHFSSAPGASKLLRERPIPIYGNPDSYRPTAQSLSDSFRRLRFARLVLSTGTDVSDGAYRVIERRISEVLPKSLRALDCVIRYLDRHPIDLEILIANIGQTAMMVDCVAKSRQVPSYLIINGLMGNEYLDEAKYATVINGYSESIRDNYFRGMRNVICLGDPRMDHYALCPPRAIDRERPTVTIGASGFNNIDLNSFLAVEFEYLSDVLTALQDFKRNGRFRRVLLKTRANGYSESYHRFINEYYPGLVDEVIEGGALKRVLDETDLFVSLHSQALFEASCLGIPCIYHKNDLEILDPPFNGKSELVTTHDSSDLKQAMLDFLEGSERFNAFLDRRVMEKYIGPLDGCNLTRNFEFVNDLLLRREGGA